MQDAITRNDIKHEKSAKPMFDALSSRYTNKLILVSYNLYTRAHCCCKSDALEVLPLNR